MKKFLFAAIVAVILAPDAEACLAGRRASRSVSKSKTVAKAAPVVAPVVVQAAPPVVKVEVIPAPKPVAAAPVVVAPVASTATVVRDRSRAAVRSVVGVPLTAMSKLRSVVPCPNCR